MKHLPYVAYLAFWKYSSDSERVEKGHLLLCNKEVIGEVEELAE